MIILLSKLALFSDISINCAQFYSVSRYSTFFRSGNDQKQELNVTSVMDSLQVAYSSVKVLLCETFVY